MSSPQVDSRRITSSRYETFREQWSERTSCTNIAWPCPSFFFFFFSANLLFLLCASSVAAVPFSSSILCCCSPRMSFLSSPGIPLRCVLSEEHLPSLFLHFVFSCVIWKKSRTEMEMMDVGARLLSPFGFFSFLCAPSNCNALSWPNRCWTV